MLCHAMPDASIHALGTILENLNPVLYRVSLPNGKVVLAHLSKQLSTEPPSFLPNERVVVELTPFDFDQARILSAAG
jgi:translation initiation factor IF-1